MSQSPMVLDSESKPSFASKTPGNTRNDVIPAFGTLAGSAFLPAGLVIALQLMHGRVAVAGALLGGYVIAMIVYGMLILFARHMFGLFVPSAPSGQGNTQALGFALMSSGKFIIIGAVLYVMVSVMQLSLVWLIGGFLLTQVTISVMILSRLAKTKITS